LRELYGLGKVFLAKAVVQGAQHSTVGILNVLRFDSRHENAQAKVFRSIPIQRIEDDTVDPQGQTFPTRRFGTPELWLQRADLPSIDCRCRGDNRARERKKCLIPIRRYDQFALARVGAELHVQPTIDLLELPEE